MLKLLRLIVVLLLISGAVESRSQDSVATSTAKKGLNLGALPSVLFNSDLGFQYGALANLYQYGDGKVYPDYRWSLYAEVARTTKGGGINQLNFDSKYLMPFGLRITADVSYLTQQALDFYGFNGYDARYNPLWEDDGSAAYISRMFYKLERRLLRLEAAFQKPLPHSRFSLLTGFTFLGIKINNVDVEALNKGLSGSDLLPDTITLFQLYKDWSLLPDDEWGGGDVGMVKFGVVYDSRDNEPNPMQGIWAEAVVAVARQGKNDWSKLSVTLRKYFTLKPQVLSVACRVGYQGTIWGNVPWYMQSYMINSLTRSTTVDGLGGGKSLRGILRNRIVGDAVAYFNTEIRWKFFKTFWKRQHFYFALNGFLDAGRVVSDQPVDVSGVPENAGLYFDSGSENWHPALGGGVHIAMNENFVLAVDYGHALDKRDGVSGVYIGLNWMF